MSLYKLVKFKTNNNSYVGTSKMIFNSDIIFNYIDISQLFVVIGPVLDIASIYMYNSIWVLFCSRLKYIPSF